MQQTQPTGQRPRQKLNAQVRALLAVIADTNQFELMRRELNEHDFDDSLAKELFIILEECYRINDLSFRSILNHCQNETMRQLIAETAYSGEFSQNTVQTVHDSIELIKRSSLKRQSEVLLNRIRLLTPVTLEDQQQLQLLLAQKSEIDRKLRKKD